MSVFDYGYHAEIHQYVVFAFGASSLLILILGSKHLQRLLASNVLVWTGKRSFGIYLIHALVISSAGIAVSNVIGHGDAWATMFATLSTLSITMLLACAVYAWVEKPSLQLGRAIKQWLTSGGTDATDKAVATKLA